MDFHRRQLQVGSAGHRRWTGLPTGGRRSKERRQHDLRLAARFPAPKTLRLEGYTDSKECAGIDCFALASVAPSNPCGGYSTRRTASRLSPLHGDGMAHPIGDNDVDAGRACGSAVHRRESRPRPGLHGPRRARCRAGRGSPASPASSGWMWAASPDGATRDAWRRLLQSNMAKPGCFLP